MHSYIVAREKTVAMIPCPILYKYSGFFFDVSIQETGAYGGDNHKDCCGHDKRLSNIPTNCTRAVL